MRNARLAYAKGKHTGERRSVLLDGKENRIGEKYEKHYFDG